MESFGFLVIRMRVNNPASQRTNIVTLSKIECQESQAADILHDWCNHNRDIAENVHSLEVTFELRRVLNIPKF